jgi:hypothetical protein
MACYPHRKKEIQVTTMYIRVKQDGFIYDYNEILAKNPGCEVVPEEIAYPERFMPVEAPQRVAAVRKKRGTALNLETADIPQEPAYTSPELSAEAARGMP